MTAATLDLALDAGSDWVQRLTWLAGADRAPVELAGCAASLQVFPPASSTALLTVPVTLAAGGSLSLALTAAQTGVLPAGPLRYQLSVTFADGSTRRLLAGQLRVIAPGQSKPAPASTPAKVLSLTDTQVLLVETAAQGPPGPPGGVTEDLDLALLYNIAKL